MKAKIAAAAALAACLAAPHLAAAEEGSGTVTYVSMGKEVTELANGETIIRSHSKGIILADETELPFHLASQDCRGATVIGADDQPVSDMGSCDSVDQDGDIWWLWYRNDSSGRVWKVIGGTGKYERMTGGGSTDLLVSYPDGRSTISWQGTWER
jgi:hypothetical protein